MASSYCITLADVYEANCRIQSYIHYTPVMKNNWLAKQANVAYVAYKCENLQKTGSFKARGAFNALVHALEQTTQKQSNELEKNLAVITESSGNHAAAVAYACQQLHLKADIVMPSNSNPAKIAAVQNYGGNIHYCEATMQARAQRTAQLQEERRQQGPTIVVHPSNDPRVIAGQGTLCLEFMEQCKDMDVLIIPLGGGGLLSGCTITARALNPQIKIFAAEPLEANDGFVSFTSKKLTPLPKPSNTIADGLRTNVSPNCWPILRDLVDGVLVCTEEEIAQACRAIYFRCKLVVEPSSGVALACLLGEHFQQKVLPSLTAELGHPPRVGIILCGGNLDLDAKLPWHA